MAGSAQCDAIKRSATAQGGVSSTRFVAEHKQNASAELSVRGVEKTDEISRLCRMPASKAIPHGGQVNSYYDDPHDVTGRFPESSSSLLCMLLPRQFTYADAGIDSRECQKPSDQSSKAYGHQFPVKVHPRISR